jgi:glutaminase
MENINTCTRCKKVFTDFKIDIDFHMKVNTLNGQTWEYIPNLDNVSREVLCLECFNQFTGLMAELNMKHQPEKKQ